jgi:hypothetical protein
MKTINSIASNYTLFDRLESLEIIQAMLVLPFEHQRMSSIQDFEHNTVFMGEVEYWQYHLRDITRVLEKTSGHSQKNEALAKEITRLTDLMPSKTVHSKLP